MKTLTMMTLSLLVMANANAAIVCTAIKRIENNGLINRGVQVSSNETHFSESLWFGTSTANRDLAGNACREIVKATSCRMVEPKSQDRFTDVGDLGFGPMKLVERTTKAGRLQLNHVSSMVTPHLPDDYSSEQARYFAFYERCEARRAELALEVMENIQDKQVAANRRKVLMQYDTSIPIWEKM